MKNPEFKTMSVPAEFKADMDKRTVEGYASVFGVKDLGRDIIHSGAFKGSLEKRSKPGGGWRIPLLWQHDMSNPIGKPLVLEEDSHGLHFVDSIPDTGPGSPEQRALILAHEGVIDGVSIGYIPEHEEVVETDEDWTRHLHSVDLLEHSLVTFPMNEEARVTTVRKQWLELDEDTREKVGRVLSARNFSNLEKAIELLQKVLASATLEDEKSSEDEEDFTIPDRTDEEKAFLDTLREVRELFVL
jgi:HK97 family phage prohead protease